MNAIAHSATPGSTRNGSRSETVRKPSPNELHLAFAVPGDLATPTGGYGYDRRIIKELRELGWRVGIADIGAGFPFPSTAQRATALAILSGRTDLTVSGDQVRAWIELGLRAGLRSHQAPPQHRFGCLRYLMIGTT